MPGERIYLSAEFNEPLRMARSIYGSPKTQDLLLSVLKRWLAIEGQVSHTASPDLIRRNCEVLERIAVMLERRESMTGRLSAVEKLLHELRERLDEMNALQRER